MSVDTIFFNIFPIAWLRLRHLAYAIAFQLSPACFANAVGIQNVYLRQRRMWENKKTQIYWEILVGVWRTALLVLFYITHHIQNIKSSCVFDLPHTHTSTHSLPFNRINVLLAALYTSIEPVPISLVDECVRFHYPVFVAQCFFLSLNFNGWPKRHRLIHYLTPTWTAQMYFVFVFNIKLRNWDRHCHDRSWLPYMSIEQRCEKHVYWWYRVLFVFSEQIHIQLFSVIPFVFVRILFNISQFYNIYILLWMLCSIFMDLMFVDHRSKFKRA